MNLNDIGCRHSAWVESMGWHNKTPLEAIAMIASEMGEAAAELVGGVPTDKFGQELSDIILRIADLSQVLGLDIQASLEHVSPHFYNELNCTAQSKLITQLIELSKWVNTARADEIGSEFATCMAHVTAVTLDLAREHGIDLECEIERKMKINLERGTRGRRI